MLWNTGTKIRVGGLFVLTNFAPFQVAAACRGLQTQELEKDMNTFGIDQKFSLRTSNLAGQKETRFFQRIFQ